MQLNPLTLLDSYKLGHRIQYPEGTEFVYSNWTPRGSRIEGVNKVVFVGLQYFLHEYIQDLWDDNFFDWDIEDVIAEYKKDAAGFTDIDDVQHIRDLHELGYLPLEFKALPEGSLVPLRVPMLTVENTDPRFAWLVNYIESLMSSVLWMPSNKTCGTSLLISFLS
jgi:nicotinamide phosphoribosyltransferase